MVLVKWVSWQQRALYLCSPTPTLNLLNTPWLNNKVSPMSGIMIARDRRIKVTIGCCSVLPSVREYINVDHLQSCAFWGYEAIGMYSFMLGANNVYFNVMCYCREVLKCSGQMDTFYWVYHILLRWDVEFSVLWWAVKGAMFAPRGQN